MRKKRSDIEDLLNDGLLVFGQRKTVRDGVGKKTGESFVADGSLYFNFQTINQKFDEYIVGHIQSVDLKIKCYYTKELKKSHLVIIEDDKFEILEMDPDRAKKYVFLFLRKLVD